MSTSLHKSRFRRLTCAAAAVAAAAALTACSAENEDSGPATGSEEQTQAAAESEGGGKGAEENAAPDAPLSELILAGDEVPGLNFEPLGPDGMMQDMMAQAAQGATVEPAECAEFADYGSNAEGAEMRMSGFENNSKIAGVTLSPNVDLVINAPDIVSTCPSYTVNVDNSELIRDYAEESAGEEMPPEVEEILGDDYGKSTQTVSISEVEAAAPEGVEDFFAFYLEGTETAMGQEFPVAKLQVVGVVDGIAVIATGGPFAGLDPETGELMGNPQEVDKQAYQAKAEEVFAAQVEKIRSA